MGVYSYGAAIAVHQHVCDAPLFITGDCLDAMSLSKQSGRQITMAA